MMMGDLQTRTVLRAVLPERRGMRSRQAIRIHPPGYDRRARMGQSDVNRALEVLDAQVSAEKACIYGGIQGIRRKLVL